jgi:hypothetical protein
MSEREALAKSPPDWKAVAELRAAEADQLREALREEAAYADKCADNATAQALETEGEISRRANVRADAFGHMAYRLRRRLGDTR